MANDDLAEATALVETLRDAIAGMDKQIEARARQVASQRGPLTIALLPAEISALAQRLGDLMRCEMLEKMPGAHAETASISADEWTAHAASFLSLAYRQIAREAGAKLEQQRG